MQWQNYVCYFILVIPTVRKQVAEKQMGPDSDLSNNAQNTARRWGGGS